MINRTQEEIMQDWGVDNSDTPLVSVRCITYNHEPYIAQALDGFLMQKTNFPFEVIVHDDASPDKTADIIREYEAKFPKIIKPIYETENQYSKHDGSLGRIMDAACKGKYIALCEGDDYWIDENKLQMQVDILESDSNIGLVYTLARKFDQSKGCFFKHSFGGKALTAKELILKGDIIPTLTICCRKDLYDKYYVFRNENQYRGWRMGDYPLVLWYSLNSKLYFIQKETSVYRILEESASHTKSFENSVEFIKSAHDVQIYFNNTYGIGIPKKIMDNIYRYMYMWKLIKFNKFSMAHSENKVFVPYSIKSFMLKLYLFFFKK